MLKHPTEISTLPTKTEASIAVTSGSPKAHFNNSIVKHQMTLKHKTALSELSHVLDGIDDKSVDDACRQIMEQHRRLARAIFS